MAAIQKILHSALSVRDIEKSIAFYRDVLGMELVFGPTPEARGERLSETLGVENTVLRQAVLKVPGTESQIERTRYITESYKKAEAETMSGTSAAE